jgi:hypothetical protein
MSYFSADNVQFYNYMHSFDQSTNAIKGHLIVKSNTNADASYAVFSVSNVQEWSNSDDIFMGKISVAYVDGSLPSNNEAVVVEFIRAGDKGATGPSGPTGATGATGSTGATGPSSATIVRTNLVTNPNFETNATGWNDPWATGTQARVSSPTAQSGTWSLQTGGYTDSEDGDRYRGARTTVTAVIGDQYRAGIYFRVANLNRTMTVSLRLRNGSPSFTYVDSPKILATTSWQFIETPVLTASSTTLSMEISNASDNSEDAYDLYVDSAIVELASTYDGTFFDGNKTDGGGIDYSWTGTANASTSTATRTATFAEIANAVPAGGTAGQVLVKGSGLNYSTSWTNTPAEGTNETASTGFGYRGVPRSSASEIFENYEITAIDSGEYIYSIYPARSITIPRNAINPLPVGTTIVFINAEAATVTFALSTATGDTLRLAGSGTTGNRTLSGHGMATLIKVAPTIWYISGSGLT